jgi:nucleoside-diphosphate-sugar epimerase
MSRVVLVTGSTGFVGRHLVAALEAQGSQVQRHSMRDGMPKPAPRTVSHVFHLAAKTYVPESWSDTASFYETNVLGTVKVLEFCRHSGASLTFISSYVYGKPNVLPIPEDHPLQAFNPYSHTKILSEEIARYYAGAFGVRVTIVRPFNLYGPWQDSRFLIPTLLRQALDPELPAITVADDRPRRDHLYIGDFIALLVELEGKNISDVFNAGSGRSISIAELCAMIGALTGVNKPLISRGESRPDDVMDVIADISKARRELDWSPKIPLEHGLRCTIEAFRS